MGGTIKCFTLALVLALLPTRADAVFIELFASGDNETVSLSNGTDATVNANPRVISVDLTPDVSQLVTLNEVDFEAFLITAATGSDTLSQTLSLTSPSGTPTSFPLSQSVSVNITSGFPNPTTATVTIGSAGAMIFDLGGLYDLTITPTGGLLSGNTSGEATFNNQANFLLTQVPEPSSAVCLLLAGTTMTLRRRAH